MEITSEYYEKLKESLFHLSKSKFRVFVSREESGEMSRNQKILLMIDLISESAKKMPSIMMIVDE